MSSDEREISRSILRTVIYADLFDSPIAVDSLHRHLIGCRTARESVERQLREDPWLGERVVCREDLVWLKGRDELAERRRQQRAETRDLVGRNRRLLRLLSLMPYMRMMAFSGGTSHENSPGGPDLDLFIVAARGRIWTVYGLIVLIARLCGRRRTICANYLVDTGHLRLPRTGDLFTGHELLFLKPLSGAAWAGRMLEANHWISDLFPNAGELSREHLTSGEPRIRRAAEIGLWPVWLLFERIARRIFRTRIERHVRASATADVLVGDGILKLHLHDRRAPAIIRFRERLRDAGVWHPALERPLRLDPPPEEDAAAAWDSVAGQYDDSEESNGLLRALRQRFHEEVDDWITPGVPVLDLGCGTGIDSLWLLRRGNDVTAVDLSPSMIRILEAKAAAAAQAGSPHGRLETHVLSLDRLDRLSSGRQGGFGGAVANFGSLNCASRPEELARDLGRLVRPGGYVIAAVLNRVCLWEIGYHLLRLRPRAAFRRLGRGTRQAMLGGSPIAVRYPAPMEFARLFHADFELIRIRPHGLLSMPPYLNRLALRFPRFCERLERWEDRAFHRGRGAAFADHFLIVLRRRAARTAASLDITFHAPQSPEAEMTQLAEPSRYPSLAGPVA